MSVAKGILRDLDDLEIEAVSGGINGSNKEKEDRMNFSPSNWALSMTSWLVDRPDGFGYSQGNNAQRQPDGSCPVGTFDHGRAGCLTPVGQAQMDADFCRALGIPLTVGAVILTGPEILAGRAVSGVSSSILRALGGAGIIQGAWCL